MLIRGQYVAALTVAGIATGSTSGEMADIGALEGDVCIARAVNDAGAVVGSCRTGNGHFEPTYWGPGGAPAVLAHLEAGRSCEVLGIGNSGVAIGHCEFGDEGALAAVRWSSPASDPQRLNALEGHMHAHATKVNHAGTIAGASVAEDGAMHPVIWTTGAVTPTPLSEQIPSVSSCMVMDMTDEEEPAVVGFCGLHHGSLTAVRWTKGEHGYEVTALAHPEGTTSCEAMAVNAKGRIAGTCETLQGDLMAVRWQLENPTLAVLHNVAGAANQQELWAEGINDAGDVVGNYVNDDGLTRAFVWSPAGDAQKEHATDLGSLGGFWTAVTGIANDGTVAGTAQNGRGSSEGFVWSPTMSITGLGNLGGFTSAVTAISDGGTIAGTSQTGTGRSHAFRVAAGGAAGCRINEVGGAHAGAADLPRGNGAAPAHGVRPLQYFGGFGPGGSPSSAHAQASSFSGSSGFGGYPGFGGGSAYSSANAGSSAFCMTSKRRF